MKPESNQYKGLTPLPTQNLKRMSLWVFFLIRCSTFSFLHNVGFTLTLEFPTSSHLEKHISGIKVDDNSLCLTYMSTIWSLYIKSLTKGPGKHVKISNGTKRVLVVENTSAQR